jgi:hypothetical protein
MLPVTLSPGHHNLVVTDSRYKGREEVAFDCAAGDVRYASISGNITRHWWGTFSSTLCATVTLADALPMDWSSYSILLYRRDRWLVEPDPDTP